MTTQEAVELWGGVTRLAKTIGLTRDAIYKWGQYPPIDVQYRLIVLSGGRLSVTFQTHKKESKDD